jgi:catechol 2,3-dioxygenase-like lactoylglutathione lyase family enzyme
VTGSGEQVRRVLGWIAAAAAALLVVLVLAKDNSDALVARLIYSSALAVVSGLIAVVGARLVRREDWRGPLGALTVLIAISAFVLLMVLIWKGGHRGLDPSKGPAVMGAIAFALGGASLLFSGERDDQALALARAAGAVALAAFTVLAIFAVTGTSVSPRLVGLTGAVFLPALLAVPVLAASAGRPAPALALDHAVIAVSDRVRSDHFYSGLLGATVEEGAEGRVAYRIGAVRLNVHHPGAAAAPLAARPVEPGNSDLCFVWPGSAESAVNRLHAFGIPIVEGPVLREGSGGLGVSVYCRDPDGSLIELISYS